MSVYSNNVRYTCTSVETALNEISWTFIEVKLHAFISLAMNLLKNCNTDMQTVS